MKRLLVGASALTLAVVVCLGMSFADDDKKPKHTIKQVMKRCMKGGLCKKVESGKASEAEKKELLAMFQALAKNKPPKGDADSWKTKTTALVKAAKEAAEGKSGAAAKLEKARSCGGCHKAHKGK